MQPLANITQLNPVARAGSIQIAGVGQVFKTSGTDVVALADEVAVMSARPGRIVDHLQVSLPRPRTYEMLSGDAFGSLRERIWRHIRKSA